MKRQNNLPSNAYFSPPSPNAAFNVSYLRSAQRESQPVESSRQQDIQHRYSNNVDPGPSNNNAFAHLRSQISNLRSEFTRLIQKDVNSDKPKDEKSKLPPYHKEQRLTAHSTIGFYNQSEGKPEQKGEYFFKSKLALNDQRGSIQNAETQKRIKLVDNGANISKYHKKYSFQTQDRFNQTSISQVIDPSKIQELEIEIRKLGQIKHKFEEENLQLKKEMQRIEKDFQSRIQFLVTQNENLKNAIEQAQISISLKQSLVQKLEKDNSAYKSNIESFEAENLRLLGELKVVKADLQQAQSFRNFSHELEMKQEQSERQLRLKQKECSFLRQQKEDYQQKYRDQIKNIESFQNIIKDLQSQHEFISQQYKAIQQRYQTQDADKQDEEQMTKALQQRVKFLEDQNIDFKKRVDSYKKTVEQLNNANNSSREKSVGLKEELRKGKEQIKFLAGELQMKEKLITSLYRDINILDADIRHAAHLKMLLASNFKYIDEINQIIVQLEFSKLNEKYRIRNNQNVQYS